MNFNILGNIFGTSGYASHTRNLANAMNEIGLDIRLDCPRQPGWERQVSDAEFLMLDKEFNPDSTTIMVATPQFWSLGLADKPDRFFGFCVWEGDCVPKFWREGMMDKRVDKILVPSKHVRKAVVKTCPEVKDKIVIIPHGVDCSKYYPLEKKSGDNFVFACNKGYRCELGWADRGGVPYLLKAFADEFSKDDAVELRIKLNPAYLGNVKPADVFKSLGLKKKENRPRVMIAIQLLDDVALNNFYNDCDVLVSTSLADGFNLPILEGLACGKPALVTAHSGHCDFVNDKNGWTLVKGVLKHLSAEPMYEEVKWFEPSIREIRQVLRKIYNNRDQVADRCDDALKTAQKYTWINTAKKIKAIK